MQLRYRGKECGERRHAQAGEWAMHPRLSASLWRDEAVKGRLRSLSCHIGDTLTDIPVDLYIILTNRDLRGRCGKPSLMNNEGAHTKSFK